MIVLAETGIPRIFHADDFWTYVIPTQFEALSGRAEHSCLGGKKVRLNSTCLKGAYADVGSEPTACVVNAGTSVIKQLQAELTRIGCCPQFAANVGMALVPVIVRARYVAQKYDACALCLASLIFRRQLSPF